MREIDILNEFLNIKTYQPAFPVDILSQKYIDELLKRGWIDKYLDINYGLTELGNKKFEELIKNPYYIENDEAYILTVNNACYKKAVKGLEVIDMSDYETGIIRECNDLHNVIVDYKHGRWNFFCLIENCKEEIKVNEQIGEISMYDNNLRAYTRSNDFMSYLTFKEIYDMGFGYGYKYNKLNSKLDSPSLNELLKIFKLGYLNGESNEAGLERNECDDNYRWLKNKHNKNKNE